MKLKNIIKKILLKIMAMEFFPVKGNKIIFDNFNGKGFGSHPKYIAKSLIDTRKKLDLVWIVNDISEIMPKEIRKVKRRHI